LLRDDFRVAVGADDEVEMEDEVEDDDDIAPALNERFDDADADADDEDEDDDDIGVFDADDFAGLSSESSRFGTSATKS
jgi:hypothetical protein